MEETLKNHNCQPLIKDDELSAMRQHIKIMFSAVQPEFLIKSVREAITNNYATPRLSSWFVTLESYCHFAGGVLPDLSPDEKENMYFHMCSILKRCEIEFGGYHIFSLLFIFAIKCMRIENEDLYCRQDKMLSMRDCSLAIGQDCLTTAYIAFNKMRTGEQIRDSYCWPPQLHTDDYSLNKLFEKGIAENHFHLNGSARVFDISWICLMNHPSRIGNYFGERKSAALSHSGNKENLFRENLYGAIMTGPHDNQWSWEKRLYVACMLRLFLFNWLLPDTRWTNQFYDSILEMDGWDTYPLYVIKNIVIRDVESARFSNAYKASFKQGKNSVCCLDYAMALNDYSEDRESEYRILCGERALLCEWYLKILSNEIDNIIIKNELMDIFYLYLLLKTQFRKEMIQVNDTPGFKNFSFYEIRKDVLFERFPQYQIEAYNTSVAAALGKENVLSQELRITPKDTSVQMYEKIHNLEENIKTFLQGPNGVGAITPRRKSCINNKYFYTLHFIKSPDKINTNKCVPRNNEVREKCKIQARAIAFALIKYPYLCERIRGIDACNSEIGCRPETFATEFRFLRGITRPVYFGPSGSQEVDPHLSITYHVGEDFLDMADGLRAVFEAIQFLELRSGDRIGHGTVLGLDPESYYLKKKEKLVLPKQVRLDDIVWLIFEAYQWKICVDPLLLKNMKKEAICLLQDIYGDNDIFNTDNVLSQYYNSVKLRGDHPGLYQFGSYKKDKLVPWPLSYSFGEQYKYHKIPRNQKSINLLKFRYDPVVCGFYYSYHYDLGVRIKGNEPTVFNVTPQYVRLIRNIQRKLASEIASKGISIECNPSSNLLISTFDRYIDHPIFRLSPIRKNNIFRYGRRLNVSINTDDQGIFDTSLRNEYSLLACAMALEKNKYGYPAYNTKIILAYLERIRNNGISQSFLLHI